LPRFMPIANSLFTETCFRTVMRQQFGLCRNRLWELGFEH